jgi:hypothetical protein
VPLTGSLARAWHGLTMARVIRVSGDLMLFRVLRATREPLTLYQRGFKWGHSGFRIGQGVGGFGAMAARHNGGGNGVEFHVDGVSGRIVSQARHRSVRTPPVSWVSGRACPTAAGRLRRYGQPTVPGAVGGFSSQVFDLPLDTRRCWRAIGGWCSPAPRPGSPLSTGRHG